MILLVVLSLSARRAWIEIFIPFDVIRPAIVALRKESVDRNASALLVYLALIRSLSARRAWIEMYVRGYSQCTYWVALRKESVDRNSDGVVSGSGDYGRSPQGERG